MAFQKIQFMNRSSMTCLKPEADAIVISITSPGVERINFQDGFKDVLFLEFDNTEALTYHSVRFSLSHAEEIMKFIQKHEKDATTIYVNCLQGQSRSAAVAKFLADFYNVELNQDISEMLKWIYEVLAHVYDYDISESDIWDI